MVLFVTDEEMDKHDCPWPQYHIEVPKRLQVIREKFESCGFTDKVNHLPVRSLDESGIEKVHTKEYVAKVKATAELNDVDEFEKFCTQMEDVYVNKHTYPLALKAAGCSVDLAVEAFKRKEHGFAVVRPPGHHAFPGAACGFCFFNNVVIAAKHAVEAGCPRVLIVDWDVHAGQGTQECIEGDDSLRLISIHRYQQGHFWPNLEQSAVDNKFSNTVNVPLNTIGLTDAEYLAIMELVVLPVVQDFKPELIIVSCGFDAAYGDPEGEMCVTPAGYANMTKMLMNTGLPLALILEGGYFLPSIAADFEFTMITLLGEDVPTAVKDPVTDSLVHSIGRVYLRDSAAYTSLSTIQKIIRGVHKKLGNNVPEYTNPEFTGERTVCEPYATRGNYNTRSDEFIKELEDNLEKYIKESKKNKIKSVNVLINEAQKMPAVIETSNEIKVNVSRAHYFFVYILLVLPLNPDTSRIPDADPGVLDKDQLENLVNFFAFNCEHDLLRTLPIYAMNI